jgi:hypothetical protein
VPRCAPYLYAEEFSTGEVVLLRLLIMGEEVTIR